MSIINIWNGKDNKVNVNSSYINSQAMFNDTKTHDLFIQACATNLVKNSGNLGAVDQAILEFLNKSKHDSKTLQEKFLKSNGFPISKLVVLTSNL